MGGQFGMQTMDGALVDLVRRGQISMELATHRCADEDAFQRLLKQTR